MELEPSTTAVVAIHMQGDIITAEGALGPVFAEQVTAHDTVRRVGSVLDAARAHGVQVVYTRVAWAPDYSDMDANSPMLAMTVQAGCLKDGTPMADIVSALKPQDDDLVITHQRIGAFSNSTLDSELKKWGIETLLICGVATNISVEGTARQASDLGYRTFVIADACAAASTEAHEASIASLGLVAGVAMRDQVISILTV